MTVGDSEPRSLKQHYKLEAHGQAVAVELPTCWTATTTACFVVKLPTF